MLHEGNFGNAATIVYLIFYQHCGTLPNPYIVTAMINSSLADQYRHIKKKKLRDISNKIRKVQLRMRSRKAKRDIPRLQAKLNALNKEYNETWRGNFQKPARKTEAPKLCPVCHGSIGRGYHICKPGNWKR